MRRCRPSRGPCPCRTSQCRPGPVRAEQRSRHGAADEALPCSEWRLPRCTSVPQCALHPAAGVVILNTPTSASDGWWTRDLATGSERSLATLAEGTFGSPPAISRDRTHIAHTLTPQTDGNPTPDLYIMSGNRTDCQLLQRNAAAGETPVWSSDGLQLFVTVGVATGRSRSNVLQSTVRHPRRWFTATIRRPPPMANCSPTCQRCRRYRRTLGQQHRWERAAATRERPGLSGRPRSALRSEQRPARVPRGRARQQTGHRAEQSAADRVAAADRMAARHAIRHLANPPAWQRTGADESDSGPGCISELSPSGRWLAATADWI